LEFGEACIGEARRRKLRCEQVKVRGRQLGENLDASYALAQRPPDGGVECAGIERVESRLAKSFGFHAVT
jgi:hypothetical protein